MQCPDILRNILNSTGNDGHPCGSLAVFRRNWDQKGQEGNIQIRNLHLSPKGSFELRL